MLKAMLIDDEKIALDVLEILLHEIGGVTVASKCQIVSEALDKATALQPDLIFLDIDMPGMNGLEAARQLVCRCPDVEIVFVTAYQKYSLDAFESHAMDYLLKPVAKERLMSTLERYVRLQRKRPGASPSSSAETTGSAAIKKGVLLKLLGSMELYGSDDMLITWRTKKTKELFAYLWNLGGSPVYRYRIIDDLWPDTDSKRAQTLFHTTLYNLRNMLKAAGFPNKVGFGDERYWMNTEWISSDLEQLESAMSKGKAGIVELLALYRGEFLETEHYHWANYRRLELRRTYIRHLKLMLETATEDAQLLLQQKLRELDSVSE